MGGTKQRKCYHCRELYHPDRRNLWHQKYCSKAECQQARKRKNQRRWLSKPENRNYFKGPEHTERVRAWRAAHPEYWRRETKVADALQDDYLGQDAEKVEQSGKIATTALQDVLASQPFVLIGLIAQITGITLQDEIASTGRRLLRLGQDILRGTPNEKNLTSRTTPAGTAPVQLGGPTSGP